RPSADHTASPNFTDGHANAMIVGPNGYEPRTDVWVGVSLLAPRVRYPDHDHAPEEVYLVLSQGRFRQGEADWFEPGIGGSFYNTPNVKHAMASGDAPLFAVWCLAPAAQI
ncbi:MAG: dimethylsulfonioproprionate lyase family protein, partial [Parvibaculaceae bacterium]